MTYRLGCTLEHIGAILGIGPGAADGRITRTVARLRERVRENFDESIEP